MEDNSRKGDFWIVSVERKAASFIYMEDILGHDFKIRPIINGETFFHYS